VKSLKESIVTLQIEQHVKDCCPYKSKSNTDKSYYTICFDDLNCINLNMQRFDRHWLAYSERECDSMLVMNPGNLHFRMGGEKHVNEPLSVANLQVRLKV
jgi:hypothetical protein